MLIAPSSALASSKQDGGPFFPVFLLSLFAVMIYFGFLVIPFTSKLVYKLTNSRTSPICSGANTRCVRLRTWRHRKLTVENLNPAPKQF